MTLGSQTAHLRYGIVIESDTSNVNMCRCVRIVRSPTKLRYRRIRCASMRSGYRMSNWCDAKWSVICQSIACISGPYSGVHMCACECAYWRCDSHRFIPHDDRLLKQSYDVTRRCLDAFDECLANDDKRRAGCTTSVSNKYPDIRIANIVPSDIDIEYCEYNWTSMVFEDICSRPTQHIW